MTREEEDEYVLNRKRDYQMVFGSPAGKRVIDDLSRICFISTTDQNAFVPGDRDMTIFRLGLQEAWRHIVKHIELPTEKLIAIYFPARTRSNDGRTSSDT